MTPKRPFAQAGFRTTDGKVWGSGPFHDISALPDDFELESEGFLGHDGAYFTREEASKMLQAASAVQSEQFAFANPDNKIKTHNSPMQGGQEIAKGEDWARDVRKWLVKRKIYRAKSLKKAEGEAVKVPPSFLPGLRSAEIYLKSMDERPEFAAARTLSGRHPSPKLLREALGLYSDPCKQALHAYGMEVHPENVTSIKSLMRADIDDLLKAANYSALLAHPDEEVRTKALLHPQVDWKHPDTPEFKNWFQGSHAVDHEGKPRVVFHGTRANFSSFDPTKLGSATEAPSAAQGFFFSGRAPTAETYTNVVLPHEKDAHDTIFARARDLQTKGWKNYTRSGPAKRAEKDAQHRESSKLYREAHQMRTEGGNIMPVYVSLKNPHVHDMGGKPYRDQSYNDIITQAKAKGHDGVIIRNTFDAGNMGDGMPDDIYVAFHPHQIKSAISSGYNPNEADITKAEASSNGIDTVLRGLAQHTSASVGTFLKTLPEQSVRELSQYVTDHNTKMSQQATGHDSPKLMYHGSPNHEEILRDGFKLTEGRRSLGVFGAEKRVKNKGIFVTPSKAVANFFGENRAEHPSQSRTLPVYVNAGNTLDMQTMPSKLNVHALGLVNTYQGSKKSRLASDDFHWLVDQPEFIDAVKQHGFHSIAFPEAVSTSKVAGLSSDERKNNPTLMVLDPAHVQPHREHIKTMDDLIAHAKQKTALTKAEELTKKLPEAPTTPQAVDGAGSRKSDFVVTHNLTQANLEHAEQLGGLAAPSLAVAHRDHPLNGFGDITLVAHPEMIDPKNGTPVFDADIYSPRHPRAVFKIDDKKMQALRNELKPHAAKTGAYIDDVGDKIQSGDMRHDNDHPQHWMAFANAFLASKGINLEHPQIPVAGRYSEFAEQPEMQAFKKKWGHSWGEYTPKYHNSAPQTTLSDENAKKEFHSAVMAAAHRLDEPHKGTEFEGVHAEPLAKLIDKNDGEMPWHLQREMVDALHQHGHTKADPEAARTQLRAEIAKHPDFKDWYDNKIKGVQNGSYIPNGFTSSGNRRRIPYTLDNVLKLVTKKIRGGENFHYGVGTIRSSAARKFSTLDEIRAHGHRLVSADEMKQVKDAHDEEFGQIASLLQRHHSSGSDYGFMGTVSRSLMEAAKKGKSIQGELAKDGFRNVPPEVIARIKTFLTSLRDAPTEYFEAKPQRAVKINEFKGAAVPHTTDPAFIQKLKDKGLHVELYNKEDGKDDTSRAAAIQRIADAQKLHLSEKDILENIRKGEEIEWLSKAQLQIPGLPPMQIAAATRDGEQPAKVIQQACADGLVYDVVLDGKHSAGAKIVFDEASRVFWLLKPGSGHQSNAAGLHETNGTQPQRETAFSAAARDIFHINDYPNSVLLNVDGTQVAAVEMARPDYVAAQDLGNVKVQHMLQSRLNDGTLFQWALIDYILGNTDSHGHNMLIEPEEVDVMLIDHGAAFAGRDFSPGIDPSTFVPYYLRVWSSLDFHKASPEEKAVAIPAPQPGLDAELALWLNGISPEKLAQLIEQYGIDDGGAAVTRLAILQDSQTPGADVAKYWAGFKSQSL